MELDYYDDSSTGEAQAILAECDYAGQNCQFHVGDQAGCPDSSNTVCSGNTEADGFYSSSSSMTGDNITVDNYNHRYVLFAGNTTNDGSTAISQVLVGYKLQVSPAPAVATFNDVPTSHPFFQYVQALAQSGITGGCGSGNYCPDAPVTRGQMAVFLAKALGLQWN